MPDKDTIAIGAPNNEENGADAGHVRIYRWNGQSWNLKSQDLEGEYARDLSGHSVSMPDSNTIAVGAIYNDGNGSGSGHVRIYQWFNSTGDWYPKGQDINGEAAGDNTMVVWILQIV